MANRTPLHFSAAVPERDRIQTATQEFIRRYKNTSRDLPACEIETILKEYSRDLRRGGFSQEWVARALDAGTTGYMRMVDNEIQDICPINRPEHRGRKSRRIKKPTGKTTRFKGKSNSNTSTRVTRKPAPTQNNKTKNTPAEAVLFIPFPPTAALKGAFSKLRMTSIRMVMEKS